jgi:sulfur relay (sulfurtransferase) DsrF/TusC family protein
MKQVVLITIALLVMAGCSDEGKKEVKETVKEAESFKTVQYYLDHKDLREVRLKECRYLKKMTEIDQIDCTNANKAELRSKRYKYTDWGK